MLRVGAAAGVAVMAGQTIWAEIRWSVVLGTILLAMFVELLVCVASLPEAPFPGDLWGERPPSSAVEQDDQEEQGKGQHHA
jgi:hypothetical protein